MASQTGSPKRTLAVTTPRQLAPTVGPSRGSIVFSEGARPGIEKLAIGRLRRSRHGNYYNHDTWGPEFAFIESGLRVPFRGIQVFVGFVGTSSSEPVQMSDSVSGDATLVHSDGESSVGNNDQDETGSIHQLFEDRLGGNLEQIGRAHV